MSEKATPKKRRKFQDRRGWITVYWNKPMKWATKEEWKFWSMTIYRNNGSAYLTVFAKTRRELAGLMRTEIALKKNPALEKVHTRMGGARGSLYNHTKTKTFTLQGLNHDLAVIDDEIEVFLGGQKMKGVVVSRNTITFPSNIKPRKRI